jgi:hypothetical protein
MRKRRPESPRRLAFALVAVVLVLAGAAAPIARAQIDPPISDPLGAVQAWATAESLARLLPDAGSAVPTRRAPTRPPHATRSQLAQLRFTRDPAVTAANNQAVVAQLGPGHDPHTVVADIERNRRLAHEHMRSLAGRWNPNDLADVAAYVLLSGYAAYHDRSALPARAVIAVHRSARVGLALRKRIRRTPTADKQTAAEMSEIRMIYSLAALSAARARGDDDTAETTRWEIRTWVRDVYGLDLERVRLTRSGFVER